MDWNHRAYLITDMESRKIGITTSGATAVSLLVNNNENGKRIIVANVGDSRAVLCSSLDENGYVNVVLPSNLSHNLLQGKDGRHVWIYGS